MWGASRTICHYDLKHVVGSGHPIGSLGRLGLFSMLDSAGGKLKKIHPAIDTIPTNTASPMVVYLYMT